MSLLILITLPEKPLDLYFVIGKDSAHLKYSPIKGLFHDDDKIQDQHHNKQHDNNNDGDFDKVLHSQLL